MLPGRRTPNGALYVIQATPPAGTPLVGGIAVHPDGAIYVNGLGITFNPSFLFEDGEQGAWYDPSDLSTMFQDSLGTTPVTADGQPVGLILDKSKGLILGPEAIQDVGFDDTNAWTKQTGWSVAGGVATFTPGTPGFIIPIGAPSPSIAGKRCKIIVSVTSGQIVLLGSQYAEQVTLGVGTHTVHVTPSNNSAPIYADVAATVTSFSVQTISGNHASQATAASRPLYKTDGSYHWLQFDGVDDYIGCLWPTITSLSTLVCGVNRTSSNSWVMFAKAQAAPSAYLGVCVSGDNSLPHNASGSPAYTVNNALVTPVTMDAMNTAVGVSSKKVVTVESIDFNDVSSPWTGFLFGVYNSFSPQFNVYSVIVRGALSTTQEITDTETWVNGKTGAY